MGQVLTLEYFIEEGWCQIPGCQCDNVYCIQWLFKETVNKGYLHPRGTKSGEMLPTILVLVDF